MSEPSPFAHAALQAAQLALTLLQTAVDVEPRLAPLVNAQLAHLRGALDLGPDRALTVRPVFLTELCYRAADGSEEPLEVYRDPSSGGVFALDATFLDQVTEFVVNPFNPQVVFDLREEAADDDSFSAKGESRGPDSPR